MQILGYWVYIKLKDMSLRKKTLVIVLGVVVVALVYVVLISQLIILKGFRNLEREQVLRNLDRAEKVLETKLSSLSLLNRDWAFLDDAYGFVQEVNDEFVSANLADTTFADASLNLIAFFDSDANKVYLKTFDLENKKEITAFQGLEGHFEKGKPLISHKDKDSKVSGIISLPSGPFLVSSYPILTSDGKGPIAGSLIMGSFLTDKEIKNLGSVAEISLGFFKFEEALSKFPEMVKDISTSNSTVIKAQTSEAISGFRLIKDIYGNSSFILQVDGNRSIFQEGLVSINYFIMLFFIIGLVLIFLSYTFLNKFILSPIFSIEEDMKKIISERNFSGRISYQSKDEMGKLSEGFNQMLTTLEELRLETEKSRGNLSVKVSEIENKNKELEETREAMVKLLQDEKMLKEELEEERDRIKLIISSMGEGLLVIDNNHNLEMINPVAEELLQVEEKEVIGKRWSEIVTTLKNQGVTPIKERSFSKAISKRRTIITQLNDDHYYRTKKGKIFPVISVTAPLITSEGEIIGAVKVFNDATEEKEAKAVIERKVEERTRQLRMARDKISQGWLQLQEEKARLTASINNIPLGFFIIDKDHNILILNPSMEEILGRKDFEWDYNSLRDRLKQGKISLEDLCAHCRTDKSPYGIEEMNFENKILRIISVPIIMPEKDEVIGSGVLVEDITEAKILERSKDEFFSIASHELRTPLTAIRGNTSLIKEYYWNKFKDKELKGMFNDIHESSERLIEIVNDFLDLSRLEQNRMMFNKETFDLIGMIKDVLVELKLSASLKGLYLNFNPRLKTKVRVIADKERVMQVLINLVGNAIKFSVKGGATLDIAKKGSEVEISIADTGRGISLANQKLLFRKFQQAGESLYTRDTTKGTGLGLYISKLILENMGGKIRLVKSKPKIGSVFAFTLPLAKGGAEVLN
ncbi:hypothetical protein A2892_05165 [Candidatus Woesebacteria bacterium RIFCSPLOWO2_01_FULL_39_10b]|uniref:histidine kinase n=1 Tax=Candidatus Woesebacteria bacterium RIFCSPLOWO2_01_FULL_39_10b TaxID=1802517 RepID=A0A1F8B5D0_9BACT|nr:MAG: hypothetical protein A2892_05165 [Candidatus Woesebacteria bacterium RIFCSPLOWO2_01_FULL_39_10b]